MPNATRVREILLACFFNEEETKDRAKCEATAKMSKGLTGTFGFHPDRLEQHRKEIAGMLLELDPAFFSDGGQGMSFLNLPFDAAGTQWGEQRTADELYMLANALGLAEYNIAERALWAMFPGGVPYIVVNRPACLEAIA